MPAARKPALGVIAHPQKVGDPKAARALVTVAAKAAGLGAVKWIETTADDPGTGQARALADAGVPRVVAWGGDGTVRAVAAGLLDTDTSLGIIPGGTGNLLTRNLEIPLDVEAAIPIALGEATRRIDVLEVGLGGSVTVGLVIAGMGMDAHLMTAPENLKSAVGPVAYVLGMGRAVRAGSVRAGVSVDGGAPEWFTARTVMVANVGGLIAGMDVAPEASPDDGDLDVVVLPLQTARDWGSSLLGVLTRRKGSNASRTHRRGKSTLVVTRQPVYRQVDGDVVGKGTRLEVRVRPGALAVAVPA